MVSQGFEAWLDSLSASMVTEVLLWTMGIVFVLSIILAIKRKSTSFVRYAPTLLTSLGILGTFTGIVIGLLHFDSQAIDTSIPNLLEGVKVAFVTSVAGLGGAIFFNFLDALFFSQMRSGAETQEAVSPEMIHTAIEKQTDVLKEIARAVSGSEEGSIVGQQKLLRSEFIDFARSSKADMADFSTKLWAQLEAFTQSLSKSATSQIIEALRQVIVDFNEKITEQFGENFKALDASVKKLVDWQVEYKSQIEKMGEQYQQSVDSLVQTRTAVAGIWTECKEIPYAMAELREVILVNQQQIVELQKHLEAFVHMRDAAIEAVPTIQQKVESIGDLLHSGAAHLQNSLEQTGLKMLENSNDMKLALQEGAEGFRDSVATTQQAFSSMSKEVTNASDKLSETMEDATRGMHEAAKDVLDNMRRSIDDLGTQLHRHSSELHTQFAEAANEFGQRSKEVVHHFRNAGIEANEELANTSKHMASELTGTISRTRAEMDAHITESLKKFTQDINYKLELFETTTMRELNSELEKVGVALTSITGRFVEDYQKLVNHMDEMNRVTIRRTA